MKRKTKGLFVCLAEKIAAWSGSPSAFILAAGIVVLWAILGPFFDYSDTWQLVINTGTTIVTFLMVFLIQNTQNRDTHALHLKLDELIRATKGAHTVLLDLEELEEHELQTIKKKYTDIAAKARESLRQGKSDTDLPEIVLNDSGL